MPTEPTSWISAIAALITAVAAMATAIAELRRRRGRQRR